MFTYILFNISSAQSRSFYHSLLLSLPIISCPPSPNIPLFFLVMILLCLPCHTLVATLLWNFCRTYLCLHLSRYVRLYWYMIYCCSFYLSFSLLIVSPFLFTGCNWIDLLPLSLSFHASPTLSKHLSHNSTISLYTALSSSTSCSISLLLFPIAIFCNSFSFFPSFSFTLFDAISHYTFLYLCDTIPLLLPFLFSNQFVFVACSLSLSLSPSLPLAHSRSHCLPPFSPTLSVSLFPSLYLSLIFFFSLFLSDLYLSFTLSLLPHLLSLSFFYLTLSLTVSLPLTHSLSYLYLSFDVIIMNNFTVLMISFLF